MPENYEQLLQCALEGRFALYQPGKIDEFRNFIQPHLLDLVDSGMAQVLAAGRQNFLVRLPFGVDWSTPLELYFGRYRFAIAEQAKLASYIGRKDSNESNTR